jgi:hypothetical protein
MPVISRSWARVRSRPAGAIVGLLLAACGSTWTFDGTTYRRGPLAFRVGAVPPPWRRVDVAGATLAFRDEGHGASILVDARCDKEDSDTPLAALTAHLLSGTTERNYQTEETIAFDAREARHTIVQAKLDGVLLAYDIFVLNKDGCTYDFVYVAPTTSYEGGSAPFERFAQGFRTLGAGDVSP